MSAARLVAAAAGLAAVAALAGAPVPAAARTAVAATAGAKPGYVGIVISGHGSACVRWKAGISGDTVLNDVATVTYRPSDGLIVQIDGTPKSARADANHYWSYWHDAGSGWSYSSVGASGYHPAAGTVEGWSYIDGTSNRPPPGSGSYAALCGALDRPKPTPTPTPSPTRTGSSTKPRPAPQHTPSSTQSTVHPHDHATTPTGPAATRRERPARSPATRRGVVAATVSTATVSPAASAASARAADHGSSGSALPTLITAGIVLVLGAGGAAGWYRRRSPR